VNQRGHYLPAAILVTIMVLVAADYNLYQGNGIHDPGIVSLPILVTFGSLLFGKRAAPFFALAGIVSVIAIGSLEISGAIHTTYKTDWDDILTISILIAAAGLIVWVVMENLEKSMRQARQSEANMRQAYYSTLEGWAKALEYRDRETEGHSRKVTAMTVRLAKELGFSEEEMTHIYRGALLHDIGKMALPDQVLFKPGPLDAEEWKQVKQHPIFARDLLDKIPFLQPSLSIPYSHHERWDGKGYPQGLKGEEIPLAARIFTLVDHYEALNSDRPYRKAWLKEKILVYINENAGTIFDPLVVKTFFRLYERGEIG
jgi:HD-GYP domain-containing protein (c-di-GMP phosphodiesterase class II)